MRIPQIPSKFTVFTATVTAMLTVTQVAQRVGRDPETVRGWIRSGKLEARRANGRMLISESALRDIENDLFPMADLPGEWAHGDHGLAAPNWVAALRRSRGIG